MNRSIATAATLAVAAVFAGCGGATDKPEVILPQPPVRLVSGQSASLAIGQPDLTTGTAPATCAAGSLESPYGAPAWDGTRLFVSDTNGNRVHAYTVLPTASGATPAFDLGQPDCAVAGDPTSASELSWPQSIRAVGSGAGGKLVVTDSTNHRVLLFSGIPSAAPASAAVAVGQADLTTLAVGCDASALDGPQSAFVTPGGKLIVADQGNNRVLVWSSLPTASATPAALVLGQASMTSCNPNDDPAATTGDVTAATLNAPTDVWSDGSRLVVVDSGNNRVLVWNTFPTVSGKAADAVIGQGSFTTAASGVTGDTLARPVAIASDGTQLFVADAGNHRVLAFEPVPSSGTGATASVRLGQADFTSGSANAGSATTAASLSDPAGLAVIDGALFVTDAGNHRVLVFRPAP